MFPALEPTLDVFVIDTTVAGGLSITEEVRRAGRSAERTFDGRSMRAQMKAADRSRAAVAVIVGADELAAGTAVVRPLRDPDGEQLVVARTELVTHLEAVLP